MHNVQPQPVDYRAMHTKVTLREQLMKLNKLELTIVDRPLESKDVTALILSKPATKKRY